MTSGAGIDISRLPQSLVINSFIEGTSVMFARAVRPEKVVVDTLCPHCGLPVPACTFRGGHPTATAVA